MQRWFLLEVMNVGHEPEPVMISVNGVRRRARFANRMAALEAARIIESMRTDSAFEGVMIVAHQ